MSGDVPRLRDQATTLVGFVHQILADKDKRANLSKDTTSYLQTLASVVQEHLSDTEKRNALLGHAHEIAAATYAHVQDPEKRQSLATMAQGAGEFAQQAIKDPSKRAEIHDLVAKTLHELTQAAQAAGGPKPTAS